MWMHTIHVIWFDCSTCLQEALKTILTIFAKLNPGIRYVQGMNEILAPLYYVFRNDPDEESAVCSSLLYSLYEVSFYDGYSPSILGLKSKTLCKSMRNWFFCNLDMIGLRKKGILLCSSPLLYSLYKISFYDGYSPSSLGLKSKALCKSMHSWFFCNLDMTGPRKKGLLLSYSHFVQSSVLTYDVIIVVIPS